MSLRFFSAVFFVFSLTIASASAVVRLASPFTDHMVLQREMPVPLWGTADAGETVTVAFAGQTHTTTADAGGRWRVALDPMPASAESRALRVMATASSSPSSALTLTDVLVGEVWLASGQSNMDFTVAKTPKYYFAGVNDEAAEVAAAHYPLIRMFTGEWSRAYDPQREVGGAWKLCTPDAVREFSAIGYFFARDLQRELHIPIGIVTLTYGASTAQAWIRREAIAADPALKPTLDAFDAKVKHYVPPTATELAEWRTAADRAKSAGRRPPRRPRPDPVQDQHNPTVMFNGMIAPFIPYAIRGVIWYQGESITAPRDLFPRWNETLITDWRKLWGRAPAVSGAEPLPFYFCQLAALDNASNSPQVREWQAQALALPDTAMAVTIDIGDKNNVHPKNKQDVGARLARIALAKNYGRPLEYSGPVLSSVRIEGDAIRVRFSHADGGLVARGGGPPLRSFVVAGADGHFVPADATIEGDSVIVRSSQISAPVAARYAWSNFPEGCNLANAAGLLAAPFRTDRPIEVYLIGGQSNATGQGYVRNLPAGFAPCPDVLLYHSGAPHLHGSGRPDAWESLQPASESPDRFGPELGFGNRLQTLRPGRRIALIKHAHSGTNLHAQWAPGANANDRAHWGAQFATFVQTADAGLKALREQGYAPTLAGMIWMQGENDADEGGSASSDYAKNLTHFIARVRAQFDAPDLVFVYGLIGKPPESGPGRDVVRQAQRELSADSGSPLAVNRAFLVPTDDLTRRADDPGTPYPNDHNHFSSAGMLTLGERMAETMNAHLPEKSE
jgi:sialate O-acetylesterase